MTRQELQQLNETRAENRRLRQENQRLREGNTKKAIGDLLASLPNPIDVFRSGVKC